MLSARACVLEIVQQSQDMRLARALTVSRDTGDILQNFQFKDLVSLSIAVGPQDLESNISVRPNQRGISSPIEC